MTTNGVSNVEDADMAECDGEKVVTMMDVLQEEQDFEDDANAVLGASDEKNCTYSKGYIKRQAIYACLTCCTEAKYDPTKRAGVCLACSLNCHENHELVELYTKRNFCCDCGNSKFNSHPCQFTPNKNELNEDNEYNQNFSGLYCTCHRPYPDPESTLDDDEMIQCIICEDWLHASHLDAAVPAIDQYSEMICKDCMEKNEFLHDYSHLTVNIEMQDVDVVGNNGTDTKLINSDLNTEKVINGSDDSSIDTTEKLNDEMEVDKALIENRSSKHTEKLINGGDVSSIDTTEKLNDEMEVEKALMEDKQNDENGDNLTSQIHIEDSKENESDVTMKAETTEQPSQNLSDANTESKNESNTDTTTEKLPRTDEDAVEENTIVTENKVEENETVAKDRLEENTMISVDKLDVANVTSGETKASSKEAVNITLEMADGVSEPQESKETLTENGEESKDSLKPEDTKKEDNVESDVNSGKPKENTELTENKDKTVENISENDKNDASKLDFNDTDTKQEETTSMTTAEGEPKTNNVENEINDSSKESLLKENTDLPQEGVTINADSLETDKNSNEVPEQEINKEEFNETPNLVNNDGTSEAKIEESNEIENKTEGSKEMKRKLPTEQTVADDDNSVKKPKLIEATCIRPKGVKKVHKGATFWNSNLRQKLCTCSECLAMYKDLSVLFLIDPEDTVFAYETLGKERVDGRTTQYEKGLAALSSLDRIQQINALTEYNKMKDKLLDFLKSFKDRQEVVKEEDIKAFFAGMKPKREPDGVYFCR